MNDNTLWAVFWASCAAILCTLIVSISITQLKWYEVATPEKICASGGQYNVIFCQQLMSKMQKDKGE